MKLAKGGNLPVVSICIANFNGEALLVDCLESVLAQDTDAFIEILVHDDASNDDSLALLRSLYPQVKVLASEANVGFCISNNRMVDAARGEYVLLLNNDAALETDAISSLLSEAGRIGTPSILTLPQYDWQTGQLVDRGCSLDPFLNPIPNLAPQCTDVAFVIGACLWCPRQLWNSLGGFPEWMESIAEDLYLCGIARLRGIPVRALAVSGYRHRQGATFGGNRAGSSGLATTIKRRRLSERNKTRALMVLAPGPLMWPLLATHLGALVAEGFLLSIVRRDLTLWRAVYATALETPFCEFHELLAMRNRVQATRTIAAGEWFRTSRWQLRKVAMLMRFGVPQIDV